MDQLEPIEQEFQRIVPDWIEHINQYYRDPSFTNRLRMDELLNYETCFVGDVRHHFNLSRKYSMIRLDADDRCEKCHDSADKIFFAVLGLKRDSWEKAPYIQQLQTFKQHLKSKHHIDIKDEDEDEGKPPDTVQTTLD